MKFELFSRVALTTDFPEHHLQKGDIATVVEHHPVSKGEDGYSLEIFDAVGDTIAVITVSESQITQLTSNTVLHIRNLEVAS